MTEREALDRYRQALQDFADAEAARHAANVQYTAVVERCFEAMKAKEEARGLLEALLMGEHVSVLDTHGTVQ